MPASITQYLFGKAVAGRASLQESAAFCWGLQGMPAVPLQTVPTTENQKSFLLGLQIYDAFSRLLFPYIIGKAKQVQEILPEQPEEIVLQEVCSALDTVMLRRELGLLPSEFDFSWVFPRQEATMMELSAFAANISGEIQEKILEIMRDTAKTFCSYRDRTTLKKLWYLRREKNGAHRVSCHIRPMTEDPDWDVAGLEDETEDFLSLFDRTVEQTAKILQEQN